MVVESIAVKLTNEAYPGAAKAIKAMTADTIVKILFIFSLKLEATPQTEVARRFTNRVGLTV